MATVRNANKSFQRNCKTSNGGKTNNEKLIFKENLLILMRLVLELSVSWERFIVKDSGEGNQPLS